MYERVDRPLIPVVAGMERRGIKVDREKLAGLSSQFAEAIAALEGEIHEMAGQPFTIGSPKQLGEILFDKMGLKGGKKGKSGQYSTDQSVLEKLEAKACPSHARCWNGANCPNCARPIPRRCRPRSAR
jgi:DNA polymerase-1